MPDLEQETKSAAEEVGNEEEVPITSGCGAVLKAERESMGLSIAQVAEVTRLRRHYIEALESETWEELPPPVFVRGFIKSYAKSVGLDEDKVLELYEKMDPEEPKVPTPLVGPPETKKGRSIILVIVVLILAAMGYLWYVYLPSMGTESPSPEVTQTEPTIDTQVPATESREPEAVEEKSVPETGEARTGNARTMETTSSRDETIEEAPIAQEESAESPAEEPTALVPSETAGDLAGFHVLKGDVKGKTWVKIRVDGQDPKEYIFQPGSKPQWKAKEGFDITIGNAAGIELEFDGKTFTGLGNLGQVVRLQLPEGFQGAQSEE